MLYAVGEETRKAIEAGDQQSLLRGLACIAALWFQLAGSDMSLRGQVGFAHCAQGSFLGTLLAAACDLHDLLALSPQGREALCHWRKESEAR